MALIFRSLLVLCLASLPAQAETLAGKARVIDGDTLAIGSEHVRLFGIDAPEKDQTCVKDGQPWPCGAAAAEALAELVGRGKLICDVQERDRYGRAVSLCAARGQDVGEAMVARGAALAYTRYSTRYAMTEARAKANRLGGWSGQMVTPEAYRHGAAETHDGPCDIKGNIGTHGRIYHLPGQADYAATRINEGAGERWFCSEAEARAAGWRKAAR